jgi:hypothetical protein
VSRRASLPGAEELFRRTGPQQPQEAPKEQVEEKSTKLQVAEETAEAPKGPKHDEKVTFYCTRSDLMSLERARLSLRAEHGIAADRGKIVRAALAYVLEDFEARSDDSVLLRRLSR